MSGSRGAIWERSGHVTVDVVIEFPETRERGEGHVKFPSSPLADLLRRVEHLSDFRADSDCCAFPRRR